MRWPIAAVVVLCVAAPGGVSAQEQPPHLAPPLIVTDGYGEARIAPDRATVTLAVETKGASAATTAATNARVQQRVLDTLKALGFRAPEVSTEEFNVSPNMEELPRGTRQNGYVARNSVTVRLSDLARIGAVIDAALARGANTVESVEFSSTKRDSVSRVALATAAANSRASAEALAAALGGRIGELVEATTEEGEGGYAFGSGGKRAFAYDLAARSATPISPAEVVVSASVVTRWRFVSTQPTR